MVWVWDAVTVLRDCCKGSVATNNWQDRWGPRAIIHLTFAGQKELRVHTHRERGQTKAGIHENLSLAFPLVQGGEIPYRLAAGPRLHVNTAAAASAVTDTHPSRPLDPTAVPAD